MSVPILATKLYVPPPLPKAVLRPRLIERLNDGLSSGCRLTLISASAGFGKTTLVSEWIAGGRRPVAWLSLDEGDNDLTRFLTYLIAALQTLALRKAEGIVAQQSLVADIGERVLVALQSPQPPSTESILTALLNEIAAIPDNFTLVLDDYHLIDAKPVDYALTFLLEHLPPQMHLVIATREDPQLPLARLRARGQLTELRAADLRFTPAEAAEFLNRVMSLNLSAEDIAALEARTEGWIAGLQLAAISIRGHPDATGFIQSFTGSHRFVLDYLLEEVLHRQPVEIQTFLLLTSILDRLCSPLCDAILGDREYGIGDRESGTAPLSPIPYSPSQSILDYLEKSNLFIVPLDDERRWYRYHHLFGDLLRKRLGQNFTPEGIAELHLRASEWYENNDLVLEAFRHAAAALDIERAERLMESKKMPLYLRGAATTILSWLESLPKTVLDTRPALWWKQASLMLGIGQTAGVEEKLQAAEAALDAASMPGTTSDDSTRDLVGKIALARATLAMNQFEVETIPAQARRALEYLCPGNLPYRSTAFLTLGIGYYLQDERDAAGQAYEEALALARATGDTTNTILATLRLGQIQAESNQLHRAVETCQQVLELIGEYSPSNAAIAYMSLADINYEWNDLNAAEKYLKQSSQLAQQYDHVVDRIVLSDLYLARLKLARGDVSGAASIASQAERTARQKNIRIRMQSIAFLQAWIHFRQGDLDTVSQLARQNGFPLMQARVFIAQGDPSAALEVLEPLRQQAEAKGWVQKLLEVMAVQSIALYVHGEKAKAVELLGEVLAQAEPEGFVRLFLDEGPRMEELLSAAAAQGSRPNYVNKLLAAFAAEPKAEQPTAPVPCPSALVEPLTPRELEVLRLIAEGLSNQEICGRLFLALDTVKGHNRRIFDKLQVQRRTEAIARARELSLI